MCSLPRVILRTHPLFIKPMVLVFLCIQSLAYFIADGGGYNYWTTGLVYWSGILHRLTQLPYDTSFRVGHKLNIHSVTFLEFPKVKGHMPT